MILVIYLCLRRRRARSVHPPPPLGSLNADKGSPPMTHAQMVALKYQGYPSATKTGASLTGDESSNSPVASKPSGQIPPVPYVSQKELHLAPNPVCLPLPSSVKPKWSAQSRSPSLSCRRRPAPPPPPAQSRQRPAEMSERHRVPSPHNRDGVMREPEASTIRPLSRLVTADQRQHNASSLCSILTTTDVVQRGVY